MLLSDLVDLIKKGNSNFISANIFEDLDIDDAASLDAAVKHQISFLEENNTLKEKLDQTKASAIITTNNDEIVSALKKLNISNIIVKNQELHLQKYWIVYIKLLISNQEFTLQQL